MSNTSFPDSAVCYLLDDIPGQGEFSATGVIIGPHTILTAAHFVYDADTGATADAVSIYPGFTPGATTYNPPGALGGLQSIHTIKVADNGETLTADATQSDFAIIDTSLDLGRFGSFALDPSFTSGTVVVKGYPASNGDNLSGSSGMVSQFGQRSDLSTVRLPLSPGYSGGPLYHTVERAGAVKEAVVGTVSTGDFAMKLTKAKVALIRHWIASDQQLYAGGTYAPRGLVPQIAGTVSDSVDAARVAAPSGASGLAAATVPDFAYTDAAAPAGTADDATVPPVPHAFAGLVAALQGTPSGGDEAALVPTATHVGTTLAASAQDLFHRRQDAAAVA